MTAHKIILIGHAQHGKDTAAEIMRKLYGLKYKPSSVAAAEIFIFDYLRVKYGYQTIEQCFNDRVNHRAEWHDLICEYNKDDAARLAREILKTADIYVGMRSQREIDACMREGLVDLVVGIYDPRKPHEPKDSFDIDVFESSHIIIPNAGDMDDLRYKIGKLW